MGHHYISLKKCLNPCVNITALSVSPRSLWEACIIGGCPLASTFIINQQRLACSRVVGLWYEGRTGKYVALRRDRQADTLSLIESIKDVDSRSEEIIQMINENQRNAVSNIKIHSPNLSLTS